MNNKLLEQLNKQLDQIKRLIIFQLLRDDGVTSSDIARLLGVDSSVVRRMVPRGSRKN